MNVGPLIAGMATMPSRAALLPRALEAVLPQIDRLHLFLDRFDDVPACARDVKIIVYRSQEAGDLRANGKLLGLAEAPADALYFTMDDDIAYPRNYTARMAAHMARYDHAIALGVHGLRLHAPITRYLESRRAHPRAKPLVIDRAMHILGTDTVVIPKALATFDVRAWDAVNMVDLNFAYELAQRRIPRVIINRRRRWVHDAAPAGSDSIFAALKKDDTRQTDLARKLLELDTLRPPEPRGGFGARLANTWAERFAVFNPHA